MSDMQSTDVVRTELNYPGNLYGWACCRCDHDIDSHEGKAEEPCLAGGCTCPDYQSGHEDSAPASDGGDA